MSDILLVDGIERIVVAIDVSENHLGILLTASMVQKMPLCS